MSELIKTLLPAIVIVILAFAGLSVTLLLKRGGKFPNTHIHGNKFLNEKGISCVQNDDRKEQEKARRQSALKNLTYIKDRKSSGKK